MSSTQLTKRLGTTLPAMEMTWREQCVLGAASSTICLVQGGIAGSTTGFAVTDHPYSTRTGPPPCRPPV